MEGAFLNSISEINERLEWLNYNGIRTLANYKALLYCILFEEIDVDCSINYFGLYKYDKLIKPKKVAINDCVKIHIPSGTRKNKKALACFDLVTGNYIRSFESITQASKKIGRDKSTLSKAVASGSKCANMLWRYIDDKE